MHTEFEATEAKSSLAEAMEHAAQKRDRCAAKWHSPGNREAATEIRRLAETVCDVSAASIARYMALWRPDTHERALGYQSALLMEVHFRNNWNTAEEFIADLVKLVEPQDTSPYPARVLRVGCDGRTSEGPLS